MSEIAYAAFDPGKTTGYALYDKEGKLLKIGSIIGLEEFVDFIEGMDNKPLVIIYEKYVIDPKIRQGGTEPVAAIAIGIILSYARRNDIATVGQLNTIKQMGYMYAGLDRKIASNKAASHQWDAHAHGTYYMLTNDIIKSKILEEYGHG